MLGDQDTIAAIGTAQGVGALGIVRISGPQTAVVLKRCFDGQTIDLSHSHRAYHGFWKHPQSGQAIDEVVVLVFAEGKGFTGERAADIICHGGVQVMGMILDAALAGGCRLARPGEFTYRAVMSGRLDLTQAESILDIIGAKSPQSAALALKNIRGALSAEISAIEGQLIFILAHLEASIDFTTEDIQPVSYREMGSLLEKVITSAAALEKTYVSGQTIKRGLRVVFAGRPNVGKSSLFNALLGRERSIVHDSPGTTRDTIEEEVLLEGQCLRFVDTAGLRHDADEVEKRGIERTNEETQAADVVIYVVDCSQGMSNQDVEFLQKVAPEKTLICFNKTDLQPKESLQDLDRFGLKNFVAVRSSALSHSGILDIRDRLKPFAIKQNYPETEAIVSTHRQREGLASARASMIEGRHLLAQDASPDLVSFEVRNALIKIQEVLGKAVGDEVMDKVFREFCIGK